MNFRNYRIAFGFFLVFSFWWVDYGKIVEKRPINIEKCENCFLQKNVTYYRNRCWPIIMEKEPPWVIYSHFSAEMTKIRKHWPVRHPKTPLPPWSLTGSVRDRKTGSWCVSDNTESIYPPPRRCNLVMKTWIWNWCSTTKPRRPCLQVAVSWS